MVFFRLNVLLILCSSSLTVFVKADDLNFESIQVDTIEEVSSQKEPLENNMLDLFSINTGSFLYHAFPTNDDSNQYFDNRLFSIERKFSADSDYSFMAGTFLNSQNNRCALFGLRSDLYHFNDRFVIKGIYAYAGEFFVDAFEDCGDDGFYETVKSYTGIGFAPYIYYSAQYNFTDYWGLEGGLILPGILVMSMQWSF